MLRPAVASCRGSCKRIAQTQAFSAILIKFAAKVFNFGRIEVEM